MRDADDETPKFVLLATFATAWEADVARAQLEEEEIPVLVKGLHLGLFGAGFQGPAMGGIELYVASPELDRARTLLSL
ncbi:MAG: DUF2007 domain-containing protein [Gemmatimonadaceae bacterium]|nr:DUF2007 domain-containing protein [Gemmatimonadaceae bacterium]